MAELNVAKLTARLVLDTQQFTAGTRRAVTAAQAMQGQMATTGKATQQLQVVTHGWRQSADATTASVDKTTQSTERFAGSAARMSQSTQGASGGLGRMSETARQLRFDIQFAGLALAGITAAFVQVGREAISASNEYESAMVKIQGLTGASREQTAAWRDEILALAPEVARPPQELADALFFVGSSGVEASESMDVVAKSAQAATAGLGTTDTIAKVVVQTMAAYRQENLQAAEVIDILVGAVEEGNAEVSDFAGSIGRVTSVAAQMGVPFHEIAAAVAAMTQTMPDAAEAVTALRGVLFAVLKPGDQAEEALSQLGLTGEKVQQILRQGGLPALFTILNDALEQGSKTLGEVIPNVRAVAGALSLTGQNAENVMGIFERMSDTNGKLAKAFGIAEESIGFRFEQAVTTAKIAFIALGDAIAPVIADVIVPAADAIKTMADIFLGLPSGFHDAAVAIVAATAAVASFTIALGALFAIQVGLKAIGAAQFTPWIAGAAAAAAIAVLLIRHWGGLSDAMKALTVAAGLAAAAFVAYRIATNSARIATLGFQASLGPIGALLAAAGAAFVAFRSDTEEATDGLISFKDALIANNGVIDESIRKAIALDLANQDVFNTARDAGINFSRITSVVEALAQETDGAADMLRELDNDLLAAAASGKITFLEAQLLISAIRDVAGQMDVAIQTAEDTAEAIEGLGDAAVATADTLVDYFNALESLNRAERRHDKAVAAVAEAQADYNELMAQGAVDAEAVARAEEKLVSIREDLVDASERLAEIDAEIAELTRPATIEEIADAWDKVTLAMLDVEDATLRVEQIQGEIVDLEAELVSVNEELAAALAGTGGKLSDFAKDVSSTFTQALTPLKRFERDTDVTFANIVDNLTSNIAQFETWQSNLRKLTERGFQGLAQHLARLGPQAAEAVAETAVASDQELHRMNELFADSAEFMTDDFAKDFAQALGDTGVSIEHVNDLEQRAARIKADLAGKQRDLTRAQISLRGAVKDFRDIQKEANLVTNRHLLITDELIDLEEERTTVLGRIDELTASIGKQLATIDTLKAGDPDHQRKLADAFERIADARERERDALIGLAERRTDLEAIESAMAGVVLTPEEKSAKLLENMQNLGLLTFGPLRDELKRTLPFLFPDYVPPDLANVQAVTDILAAGDIRAKLAGAQHGAFVPAGQATPLMLHGPEVALPLDRAPEFGMGGGDTIIVQVQGFMGTKRDIINAVHEGLKEKERRNTSLGFRARR